MESTGDPQYGKRQEDSVEVSLENYQGGSFTDMFADLLERVAVIEAKLIEITDPKKDAERIFDVLDTLWTKKYRRMRFAPQETQSPTQEAQERS